MACNIKTAARLERIARKQLKISYKQLDAEEKKLVKVIETLAQNETSTNRFWRTHTKRDENNHIILDDKESELFDFLDKQRRLCNKKLERITLKNNWDEAKVNQVWRLHQQDNCHSVSY